MTSRRSASNRAYFPNRSFFRLRGSRASPACVTWRAASPPASSTAEQARAERRSGRLQKAVFRFVAPEKDFSLMLRFRGRHAERERVIDALRRIIPRASKRVKSDRARSTC